MQDVTWLSTKPATNPTSLFSSEASRVFLIKTEDNANDPVTERARSAITSGTLKRSASSELLTSERETKIQKIEVRVPLSS